MSKTTAINNHEVGSIRIKQEIAINASKEKVFQSLTQDLSAWWGSPYLIGTGAKDIFVERKLGGLIYEDWGDQQGAIWGNVTQWMRNEIFEFTGKMGMSGSVLCVVCFTLESKGNSTILKLQHDAVGHVTEKTQSDYTYGWNDLLNQRLKIFVEKGERKGLKN